MMNQARDFSSRTAAVSCIVLLLCWAVSLLGFVWSVTNLGIPLTLILLAGIAFLSRRGWRRYRHGLPDYLPNKRVSVEPAIEKARALLATQGSNRAENIEQAIIYLQQAAETARSQNLLILLYPATQYTLAEAYRYRIRGEQAENIERAIEYFREADRFISRSATLDNWIALQNGLGEAYHYRIKGNQAENLEQAIFYFEKALGATQPSQFPDHWAVLNSNLGTTYIDRLAGVRSENVERALSHLEQGSKVVSREHAPVVWASLQNNLAVAYLKRSVGDRGENVERAIQHAEQALTVRTREGSPQLWAQTHVLLGSANRERKRGDAAENFRHALAHFALALEVLTLDADARNWALVQSELGETYRGYAGGERVETVKLAAFHYEQALTIFTRTAFPVRWRRIKQSLGDMYFAQGQWREAQQAYAEAISVGTQQLGTAYSDVGRQSILTETADLFANAAYCLVQLGQADAGLVQIEAGKTRVLAEAMAMENVDLRKLPDEQGKALAELRQSIHELEYEYRSDAPARRNTREIVVELEARHRELDKSVETVRAAQPDFMPTGLDLPGILSAIPDNSALIALLVTTQGSLAFILPPKADAITDANVLSLEGFTKRQLDVLLMGEEDQGGWITLLRDIQNGFSDKDRFDTLDAYAQMLWTSLIARIDEQAQRLNVRSIMFSPQSGLGILPLHAACHVRDDSRRYLLDDYEVRYIPSIYALSAVQQRTGRDGIRALLLGVSEYEQLPDLPNVRIEVESIGTLFKQKPLIDSDATREAVMVNAGSANYLHFACHGSFAWGNTPLNSALYLTEDVPLSLSDVLAQLDLARARLVVLSACETGIADVSQSPDEFVGLSTGFLQAGAQGVISTLWTVEDLSTALLMHRFYQYHLQDDLSPADALRSAQLWLRDTTRAEILEYIAATFSKTGDQTKSTAYEIAAKGSLSDKPFAHPYYWTAFTYAGI